MDHSGFTPLQSMVAVLITEIRHKKSIIGKQVPGFECTNCDEVFDGVVEEEGAHKATCPWNYFVLCPKCKHQNNIAKVVKWDCRCGG